MNSSPTSETILVVDDQEQNLKVVGTVLSMTGYEVVLASGGEQAIKRLQVRAPDLILLDVLMPEMDGLEVCRRLKSEPLWKEIPIIFLSAADDKNLIVQALESGGVDYVTKPFNKAELLTRVRTHLALKQARDQLKQLAEDKDELLGILAHDLKNHLAGMRMSASLLHDKHAEMPVKTSTLVVNIMHSTDRMLAFVKEFLANQSAERLQLRHESVNLNDALKQAVARHDAMAQAKEISIHLQTAEVPIIVDADLEAVGQVLDNLISNAVKFSPPGRKVTACCAAGPGPWGCLTVQDEGPGFSSEDESMMFHRYARLSARPTGGEPSTGLGLSIVKRLVEIMNGDITVGQVQPSGAVFTVRLPASKTAGV